MSDRGAPARTDSCPSAGAQSIEVKTSAATRVGAMTKEKKEKEEGEGTGIVLMDTPLLEMDNPPRSNGDRRKEEGPIRLFARPRPVWTQNGTPTYAGLQRI